MTRGRKSVCVGTLLDLLHPILSSSVMGTVAMMVVLTCRAQKTKNALSCRSCGTYGWRGERCGERGAHVRRRKGVFYFMIAQLKLRTHHQHTTLGHSFSTPAAKSAFLLSFFLSSFLGQLVVSQWFWRPPHSFAFYSTRVQYATCASICTHTITPSPPFLVSYLHTYYRRSLYTSTCFLVATT